jgi:class 3 adenylate cyclase
MRQRVKYGLTLMVFGLITTTLIIIYGNPGARNDDQLFVLFVMLSFFGLFMFGISLLLIHDELVRQKRIKNIVIAIAIILFIGGQYLRWSHLIGGGVTLIVAVFTFCFIYSPLELRYKYLRWKPYSKNHFETLLLSSVDFVGVVLVLIGYTAKIQHWPGHQFLTYLGAVILLLGLLLWNQRFKREVIQRKKAHDKIEEQYKIISEEREKSESLLHNILPREVAAELKAKGKSEAKDFDEVTVLFSDFQQFTQTAESLSAKELVKEINTCFKAFDEIMQKYGIEKIKTIGDAYMAAGGLHSPRTSEAHDVVLAGLEMQAYMEKRKLEHEKKGRPAFSMRVGIHTGSVVAGIVGVKKFQYDIWGDTVNTASRMESHGVVGKVNLSSTTYEMIKEQQDFAFEKRETIEVKGKGEMEMWLVSSNTKIH